MALSIVVRKVDETPRFCLYEIGSADTAAGRVKVYKDSGDVELVRLAGTDALPARPPLYLSQVVPRLQTYHEQSHYPDEDAWTA